MYPSITYRTFIVFTSISELRKIFVIEKTVHKNNRLFQITTTMIIKCNNISDSYDVGSQAKAKHHYRSTVYIL